MITPPIWSYDNVVVYANNGASLDDLFGFTTKELALGDQKTLHIRLENHSDEPFAFFLNADARTGAYAKEAEICFPGKIANDSLLRAADVSISYRGGDVYMLEEYLYVGKLAGRADSALYAEDGLFLGHLAPYASGSITVRLSIPSDLGNAYMNSLCTVDWRFTARQEDLPDDPLADPASPDRETIRDTAAPLAGSEPLLPPEYGDTTIGDAEAPLGSAEDHDFVVVVDTGLGLPRTGEFVHSYNFLMRIFFIILLIISSAIFALNSKAGRKRKSLETKPARVR